MVLQYCCGLCPTSTWINHNHMYILSWASLPTPIPPLYIITECWAGLPVTQQLPLVIYFTCENGNPLQCSCLENPRDGGAWWAAVYGVTQSRTRLKRLSSVHMSMVLSQLVLPSPSSAVSTNPFSMSAPPFVLCKLVHQYSFSRFHIYALNIQYLFFSFWLTSLCITRIIYTQLTRSDSDVFLFIVEYYAIVYVYGDFLTIHLSVDTEAASLSWLV